MRKVTIIVLFILLLGFISFQIYANNRVSSCTSLGLVNLSRHYEFLGFHIYTQIPICVGTI